MREPVILPSSRVTVDISTIKSHLLSDPIDPFTRIPLKIEDVIPSEPPLFRCMALIYTERHTPDVELQKRIEAYITERRSKQ
jgi:ubiquitin conjugation factor E4 B